MKVKYDPIFILENVIYKAANAGIILWTENGSIKYKTNHDNDIENILKELKKYKNAVLSILEDNKVLSGNSNAPIIYKTYADRAALSFAQERLWFIEKYEEGTNAYHMPFAMTLKKGIDINGLRYALQKIVSRHEVLRTTIFIDEDFKTIQKIHKHPLPIEETKLSLDSNINQVVKNDFDRPFDLTREFPIRVKLFKTKNKTILSINIHHIASDGWSMEIFKEELFAYYSSFINNNQTFNLPDLEIQYKDYAIWQRSFLSGKLLEKQISYWREKLNGYETLILPTDYSRTKMVDYVGAKEIYHMDREISNNLRELAKISKTTLHSIFLAATNIFLGKYSGQNDIVTGSVNANRHHRQTRHNIGFFVNTQVNRCLLLKNQSYNELVLQIHKDQIELQSYQDLPFELLVDELGVKRDTSRHPIFQVMFFVLGNFSEQKKAKKTTHSLFKSPENEVSYEIEKFDISIIIDDSNEEIVLHFGYTKSLFKRERIKGMLRHYFQLIKNIVYNPNETYYKISLLSNKEKDRIVHSLNQNKLHFPKEKTISELFEDCVQHSKFKTALVFDGETLTYQQLNEKSNQLARHLKKEYLNTVGKEIKPNLLIPILLDRGFEMLIAIIAILKTGAAYVPIDHSIPEKRINYILSDIGSEIVLTKRDLIKTKTSEVSKSLFIGLNEDFYQKESNYNLSKNCKPIDLAYVIYTSGTSGKPKGVMMEHIALCNRLTYIISYSQIKSGDRHLFKTNYVFDASFFEMFTHLLTGGSLTITNQLFDINEINNLLSGEKHTSIHLVPSQFDLVKDIINAVSLSKIYFSGESLTQNILSRIHQNADIYNYYGPTELGEITVAMPSRPADAAIIGKVFPNNRHYVLDANLEPVPFGVTGELYIGGVGLARGYWKNKRLTDEFFLSNPFFQQNDGQEFARVYKTGDLVRCHTDGNLEFMGRNDTQIKIQGQRVEIREIEQTLSLLPQIKHACVVVKYRNAESGPIKYLVGYYVLDENFKETTKEFILNSVKEYLPPYMVPNTLIVIDKIPLTANGKLNHEKLPDCEYIPTNTEYVGPNTKNELILCTIWERILGLPKVGITDDFFQIGGNSLLAIKIVSIINKQFSSNLTVKELFLNTTIRSLDQLLNKKREIKVIELASIATGELKNKHEDYYECLALPLQISRYKQYKSGTILPNNATITKRIYKLNKEAFSLSINALVSKHESLRVLFKEKLGSIIQIIYSADWFNSNFQLEDISKKTNKESLVKEIIKKLSKRLFDFNNERAFLCKLIKYDVNEYVFVFVIDHIIYDNHSLNLINRELSDLYDSYSKGIISTPKPSKLGLKHFVDQYYLQNNGDKLDSHQLYYKSILKNLPSKLEITISKDLSNNLKYGNGFHFIKDETNLSSISTGGIFRFIISKEILDKVQLEITEMKVSFFNFMLASYSAFLYCVSNQNDFIIDSPMSLRNSEESFDLIGWLTGALVTRVEVKKNVSFRDLLFSCREKILKGIDHIQYPHFMSDLSDMNLDWFEISTQLNVLNDLSSSKGEITDMGKYHYSEDHVLFDIVFMITVHSNGLEVICTYKNSFAHKSNIEAICKNFVRILELAINSPNTNLKCLKIG